MEFRLEFQPEAERALLELEQTLLFPLSASGKLPALTKVV